MAGGSYQATNTSTATSGTGQISVSGPVLSFYGKGAKTTTGQGIDPMTLAIVAAVVVGAWFLVKK